MRSRTPHSGLAAVLTVLLFGIAGCRAAPAGTDPVAETIAGRVISLSPNITEILYAVDAGHTVVGVTDFCTYPPDELAGMARVGAYLNPDVERMLSLRPDLVILLPSQEGLKQRMESSGIRTLTVANESLQEVLDSIVAIGEATGHTDEARALQDELQADLDGVRQAIAGRQTVPTLVVIGRGSGDLAGIFAVGPGTFLDEMILAAGGRNVFADAATLYPQVPLEEVIQRAPQVIIEVVVPPSELEPQDVFAAWDGLSTIPAVQDRRIHVLTDDYLLIPGPRSVRTARRLQPLLHPDLDPAAPGEIP